MDERRSFQWGLGCSGIVLLVAASFGIYLWVDYQHREKLSAEISKVALVSGTLYAVHFDRTANPRAVSEAVQKLADYSYSTGRLTLTNQELDRRTIVAIGKMTWLVHLSLQWTNLTDDDLREFSKLRNLDTLALGNTKVTDAGLRHLGTLKSLRRIYVGGTGVTQTGLLELKKALPNLDISDELRQFREDQISQEKASRGLPSPE